MVSLLCEERFRYSAISSLAMALVAFWLYFNYPRYVSPAASLVAGVVFLVDAYAKWVNDRELRRITTILFSAANAALIWAGYRYLGDPFSDIVALLWVFDALLKIPGINIEWEGAFRHAFSAFMTIVLGLSLLFTVRVMGSFLFSFILGILVLMDAYVKIRFVSDRCFVVN